MAGPFSGRHNRISCEFQPTTRKDTPPFSFLQSTTFDNNSRRRTVRIYQRGNRLWGDFRDYRDVGGKQIALIPEGQKMAATDWDEAERLVADHLRELQRLRTHRRLVGLKRTATLAQFAAEHLVDKAKNEDITDAWLKVSERRLRAAVEFFGADRELSSIRP